MEKMIVVPFGILGAGLHPDQMFLIHPNNKLIF
jgi:hypothetical protein